MAVIMNGRTYKYDTYSKCYRGQLMVEVECAQEMGSDFIDKAGIQSAVMHFDFVWKWSNHINYL